MSSVVENLLKRSFKKGPFNDGRKIGLVLTGGTMSSVHGAGAVIALEELGLAHSFDFVYTASAGFPNASYFLSENTRAGASIYYEELKDKKFINFLKIWKPINFERVVDSIRNIKPINCEKLWENRCELYLKVDEKFNQAQFFNLKDFSPKDYFNILRTAISFPFISEGGFIRKKKYFDGEVTDKDHEDFILKAVSSDYTDLLIIYNQRKQRLFGLSFSKNILEIVPDGDISIFETKSSVLKKACDSMTRKVLQVFKTN